MWLVKKNRWQNQSPSPTESSLRRQRSFFGSKHKRRNIRKDSGVTEATESMCSFSSDKTDSAPWRVGTCALNGTFQSPLLGISSWPISYMVSVRCHTCCIAENIRPAPPRNEEWWPEPNYEMNEDMDEGEGFEAIVVSTSSSLSETRRFHNCGLETWLRARKEWNRRTVETLPPKPTPAEYNQLVRGLVKHSTQRTYELPRKMALSDLIDVYTDIWDGQGF